MIDSVFYVFISTLVFCALIEPDGTFIIGDPSGYSWEFKEAQRKELKAFLESALDLLSLT